MSVSLQEGLSTLETGGLASRPGTPQRGIMQALIHLFSSQAP